MLRFVLAFALAAFATHESAFAQTALVAHDLEYGVRLSLPGSWTLASARERSTTLQNAQRTLRSSGIAELREAAATTTWVPLLQAHNPSQRGTATLVASPERTMKADEFDTNPAGETARMIAEACQSFQAQMTGYGGTGTCLGHEVLSSNQRKALVLHHEAVIPGRMDNRRTIMIIPAEGLLFTFSMSVRKETYDPAVARAVLASIVLPPEL